MPISFISKVKHIQESDPLTFVHVVWGDVLVFVFVIYLFLTIQRKTLKMIYDKPYRVPFESFLNKKERHICLIILQNEAQWLLAFFFLPKLEVIFNVYPL